MKRNWIRLPLEGACNVRELGGYSTMDGMQTGWHRFLRSDNLSGLTETDVAKLLEYGVSTVIDLRSKSEIIKHPDHAGLLTQVQYLGIPFLEEDLSPEGQEQLRGKNIDYSDLYLALLRRSQIIKELFEQIAAAPKGCVLFHCAVGKDRTGVLAMLLLALAGVDKQDCQTNYMQSFVNLNRKEEFRQLNDTEYSGLLRSDPEFIEAAYDIVTGYSGGIEGFLQSCGISAECIVTVRRRIRK